MISLLLLLAVAADPAQEERARSLYAEGKQHYELAEYDQAIEAFKKAYEISHSPRLLFNIAQAYRQQGNKGCAQAVRFYQSYLRGEPEAPDRATIEQRIAELKICEAEVERLSRPPPPLDPMPVKPEVHERPFGRLRTVGVVALVLGAASAGTAIYFNVRARSDASQLEARHSVIGETWSPDLERDGKMSDTAAIALYSVAGGMVLAGVLMFAFGARDAPVAVGFSNQGAFATWSARW